MATGAHLYYFACDILWDALSLLRYLLEEGAVRAGPRFTELLPLYSGVAQWVMVETDFVFSSDKITNGEVPIMRDVSERLGNSLFSHWGNYLRAAAHRMGAAYPSIDEAALTYACYCQFLARAVSEFEDVLHDPNLLLTEFFKSYERNAAQFEALAGLLRQETPVLEGGDPVQAQALKAEVETLAGELGAEWRQAVYSAIDNLKYQPS